MTPERKRALLRAGALLLVVLALFEAVLLRGETLVGRDLLYYSYPRLDAIGQSLADWTVPRWNPWSHHGNSWFGPRGGGVLYPGFVLFAVVPLHLAMALFVALHYVLALEGARRLARRDSSPSAACAAGLVYALGGFVVSMYWGVPSFLVSAAWLPWAALGGATIVRLPRRGAAIAGLAVAMCLLAGEPQGAAGAAALALALALTTAEPSGRVRALGWVGLAVGVAAAAAGVQVLSILDELPRTDRALAGWSDTRWSFSPAVLLDLLSPGVTGDHAADRLGYWGGFLWDGELPWCGLGIGVAGLALAAAGTVAGPARGKREGLALVACGIALAAIDPGSGIALRFPSKWLVLTALGLARLVGLGFDAVFVREHEGALRVARWIAAGLLLVALPLGLLTFLGGDAVVTWFESFDEEGRIDGEFARVATAWALLRTAAGAGCVTMLLHAFWSGRVRPRAAAAFAIAILAGELLLAGKPLVLSTDTGVLEPPSLVHMTRSHKGPPEGAPVRFQTHVQRPAGRPVLQGDVTLFEQQDLYHTLALDQSLPFRFKIRALWAFESVKPAPLTRLIQDDRFAALPLPIQGALLDADLMLLTLRQYGALGDQKEAWVQSLGQLGGYQPPSLVLRNRACPPWAYLVGRSRRVTSLDDGLDAVLDPRRFPQDVVVLGPAASDLPGSDSAPRGQVAVTEFDPERVELSVSASEPGWLVVREAWSPDWSCTIDGQAAPIAQADLLYRAVRVPAGEHTVRFSYSPWWWWPGLSLGLVGWALLAAGFVVGPRET